MTNAESTSSPVTEKEAAAMPEILGSDEPKALLAPASDSSASTQWRYYWNQFILYLSKFPDYVGNFFNDYQKPITIVVLIVSAIITLKVTLAAIDAINDIPLLSPLFELIGIGYSAWFVYRYLLRAATRQELSSEIKSLKNQVVGGSK